MRLDRIQVAVRPRGVLECLDLALLVCGRRPLGVAAAAALGAVPMMLLNRAVFGRAESDGAVALLGLATAVEMPWAMAPLTVFLGQAMFAERFDSASWWTCVRRLAGAFWTLVLYQTLARGLAIVSCFGWFFWVPCVYYLGPVILLEHGRVVGVPGRCLALCRSDLGRILLLIVIDTALFGVVWLAGLWFLESFTALWRGGAIKDVVAAAFDPFAEDGDAAVAAAQAFVSWPSQIAFWLAATIVTVYRFFTYLDTRIRHEGWDIELKFRSPATYAGLRGARTVAGAVVAIAMVVAGSAVSAAAEATPPVSAEAADVDARAAVTKQKFPWYDAQADAYRPMVRVEQPPGDLSVPQWDGLDAVARGVMIAILVALVAVAVWLLVRHGIGKRVAARGERRPAEMVLGADAIESLPEAARRHDGDLLAEAERLAAAGDFAGAMVLFHGWQLVQFHGRGVIELARGKTNGRYAAEVAAAAPGIVGLFRRSSRLFEDVLFGRLPVAAADFAAVWERRDEFRATPDREAAA